VRTAIVLALVVLLLLVALVSGCSSSRVPRLAWTVTGGLASTWPPSATATVAVTVTGWERSRAVDTFWPAR